MKKTSTNNSLCIRKYISSSTWILLLLIPLLLTNWVTVQSQSGSAVSQELYDKIASLDSSFFEAYNKCDVAKIESFFTDDVEFYHEKRGLITSRKSVMDALANNLCGDASNRVRRELVNGSLQIYPVDNYGAVEIGEHRFYLTQKGQKEKQTEIRIKPVLRVATVASIDR